VSRLGVKSRVLVCMEQYVSVRVAQGGNAQGGNAPAASPTHNLLIACNIAFGGKITPENPICKSGPVHEYHVAQVY